MTFLTGHSSSKTVRSLSYVVVRSWQTNIYACTLAWIVSSEQLLAWVRNPVPLSQLDNFAPLKCSTPAVDSSMKICNGIPQNEAGLVQLCPFNDFPFYTCVRLFQSS